MSWDELHGGDDDDHEFYDPNQKLDNVRPNVESVSDEEERVVRQISDTVNKGLRDLEGIEPEEEDSKWNKYKR